MTKVRNYRQVDDAFGKGSPGWNLPFPNGNLTAAEIIAYCPHWLKSVDVVDRFINNGGKSNVLAAMINEFRDQPGGNTMFHANSVCRMMQHAMRRAGFKNWSVGNHSVLCCAGEGEWNDISLDVREFRTPMYTHPSGHKNNPRNLPAEPLEFSDLALYVKRHPSGCDALDLTECVLYAIQHPEESWIFPDDFEKLVNHLGGPVNVDWLHSDREVFLRRGLGTNNLTRVGTSNITLPTAVTKTSNSKLMARTRANGKTDSGTVTPLKRSAADDDILATPPTGSIRRSGRLRTKPSVNDKDDVGRDVADQEGDTWTSRPSAAKKRKLDDDLSIDGDFFQPDNATSSDESIPDHISEYEGFTPILDHKDADTPTRKGRRAAKKALKTIKDIGAQTNRKTKASTLEVPDNLIDPALLSAACNYAQRKPVFLKPPYLDPGRLVVDGRSVHLYAELGAPDLWASALSSSRFGGPRRHPPFRELYRLTEPSPRDGSDWAENIRWAKEQERVFGSRTWTEYDYHLEQIAEQRRDTMWVSEEAVAYGG